MLPTISNMEFLRHITVVSDEGLTVYHHNFAGIAAPFDEILFSGFTSAMIAFTSEMGEELFSINMREQSLYFQKIDEGTIVLSLKPGLSKKKIDDIFQRIASSEMLQLMLRASKFGMTQVENEDLDNEIGDLIGI